MTKTEAIRQFRELVAKYGIKWTAQVPREAHQQLALYIEVLTEEDRRAALTSRPTTGRSGQ
jgi:hypothetical protein